MAEKGYTNQEGTVDIREPGSGFRWAGACVAAGPATIPHGGITTSKCRDPENPYGFRVHNKFRAAPDMISFDLMAPKWKTRLLNSRLVLCPLDIRKRWSKCLQQSNMESWEYIEDYREVYNEQDVDSAGTIEIDGSGADVTETSAMKAICLDRLTRITPTRIGAGVTALNINAVRFCGPSSCGQCGPITDGCQAFNAVTDSGPSYLDTPFLILAERPITSWAYAYTLRAITPFNAGGEHAVGLICLSNGRIITISTVADALAYSDDDGLNWVLIALNPAGAPNCIWSLDWAHNYIGGAGGYIYKSVDGGTTWDTVNTGAAGTPTTAINDVHGYGDVIISAGANNVLGLSRDGGDTWDAVVGPAVGVALNKVWAFSEREFLIGTADGRIFRTEDAGATFDEVEDFAALLGAAASVTAWDFCGCLGDKGLVAVLSGAVGYVYRTIDHAYTFEVLRDETGTVVTLPANVGVNSLACCDPNVFVGVGDVQGGSGFMTLIK